MSGILAIVHEGGIPVDPELLRQMTRAPRARGNESESAWIGDGAALGGASTLDDRIWITADARLDARAELIRKLSAAPELIGGSGSDLDGAADNELLLWAYRFWGEQCVDHLLGDFAFAIWDEEARRLFCARDHLGVKQLSYAEIGRGLLIASEIDCLRAHPEVSDGLDDAAIADFLVWGMNRDPHTTAFEAIRSLAPGHSLTWSAGQVRAERYWQLVPPEETRFRQQQEYVERFNDLLDAAVADRLRGAGGGVLMSGGLDSPSVAAAAKRALAGSTAGVRAHATTFETLIPDDERAYADRAARALDIPIHFYSGDGYALFDGWLDPGWLSPEPLSEPCPRFFVDVMRGVSAQDRVALTGLDGDAMLTRLLAAHWRRLLRSGSVRRAAGEATWVAREQRSLPRLGIRSALRGVIGGETARQIPPWVNPALITRLDLPERWRRLEDSPPPAGRALHRSAIRLLTGPGMLDALKMWDPAFSGSPVTVAHPLLDLRLLGYVLSLPPIPWCIDKTIIRQAGRGRLPASVLERPKSPLQADPFGARLRRSGASFEEPRLVEAMSEYVLPSRLPPLKGADDAGTLWKLLLVHCLNYWVSRTGVG